MKPQMNNKGYLLPMVIIFIVISVILGMGILYLGQLEQIGTRKRLNREKAFYIAEAGAYRAYAYLKDDINWEPEEGSVDLEDGSFSMLIEEDDDGRMNIVSTGTVKGAEETVKLVLGLTGGNSWSQGLFGSERVTLENNVKIAGYNSSTDPYGNNPLSNAQVGSIKLIDLKNNSSINGDASVTSEGEITLSSNSNITGSQNTDTVFNEPLDDLPPVVIPSDLLALAYPNKSDPRFILRSGSASDWKLSAGTLELDKNNAVLEIISGDYRFKNIYSKNGTTRFTGYSRIYVEEKVEISNNSIWSIEGTLVLYLGPNSNFFVRNNAKIGILQPNGSVVPNLPVNFRIYSASTKDDAVILENTSDMAGLFYVPDGRIIIKNNRTFLGGIVTKILDLSNNITVLYDVNLNNMEIPDDPGVGEGSPRQLTIIRWTKPGWANRLQ